MWRGSCRLNISVSASFVWRCLSGSAMTPFPHPAHRTGQADFLHPACMGLFLSRGVSRDFCCPLSCHSILLFDPRRERSSVPTACFHRRRAQRQSRTAFLQRRRTRARRQAAGGSGDWPRDDPRGACHWPRSIREPRLYSVEPVWGPDHEAVIRFCGQGSEAAGPFSQRHCSHSRMRIAATSDRHRLPSASSAVRCRTLFVLSRSRMLLTPPAAARHRPAPRRS